MSLGICKLNVTAEVPIFPFIHRRCLKIFTVVGMTGLNYANDIQKKLYFFYTRTYETVHSRYKLHYPDQNILIHAPKTNIPFKNKQNWSSCLGVNDFPSSFAVLHGLDCFQMFRPTLLTASSMVTFNSLLSFVSRMGST